MRAAAYAGLAVLVLLGTGPWSPARGQKKQPACRDVPIRWFIYPSAAEPGGDPVPTAIRGDGDWYSNASGATNSVVHVCGTNPTYDATVTVGRKRHVAFSVPEPLTGSVLDERLAAGTYEVSQFMNVRNLLCVGCADPLAPFTSRMGLQLYGIGGSDYRLRFMPPLVDAPDRHTNPDAIPAENSPFESSPVLVIPQAYDCHTGGDTNPSWIVRGLNASADATIAPGENLQVGTLRRMTRSGTVHAGQYGMPFEVRIEALECYAY